MRCGLMQESFKMKAKEYLKEHNGIILEALQDYKKWFDDERIQLIDRAIDDLNEVKQ